MDISFGSALWILTGIQGSFLLWTAYGTLKRLDWILRPPIVVALMSGLCLFMYLDFPSGVLFYPHFLTYWILFLMIYPLNLFKFRYSRVDSLMLSALPLLALNALWEIPSFLNDWTSIQRFQIGIATAGWDLMAIPIMLFFVKKIRGDLTIGRMGIVLLVGNLIISGMFLLNIESFASWTLLGFKLSELDLLLWTAFLVCLISRDDPLSRLQRTPS